MNLVNALFGIVLCFPAVYGQVYTFGFCRDIPTVMPFQLELYLGTWYEYARFYLKELDGVTCARSTYSPNPDNTLQVVTEGIRKGRPVTLVGLGEVFDPINDPARGQLTYSRSTPVLPGGNYWVVKTDYDNYAVVYSCNQLGVFKVETAYILLRQPMSPSRRLLYGIYFYFLRFGINPWNFMRTDFRNCRRPYLGTWYEYARFYLNELDGVTCAKSTYSLNPDSTIRVITTGIKRRTGQPVRLEGVGEVFDPFNEPERGQLSYCPSTPLLPRGNYWVVKTDYNNYGVVYSCNQRGKYKVETAYIFLRQQMSPSKKLLQYIYASLELYGIDTRNFIPTNFSSCKRPHPYHY